MIIATDDELIQRLVELGNPTGGNHTPTPWARADEFGLRTEDAIKLGSDGFLIRSNEGLGSEGLIVAAFRRKEDRDLALYFANIHAGVIALLRSTANSFDFIEKAGMGPERSIARKQAELLRAYADLFCRLGTPAKTEN